MTSNKTPHKSRVWRDDNHNANQSVDHNKGLRRPVFGSLGGMLELESACSTTGTR